MWIIPRISGTALAVVLLLSGCVPTAPPASPTPGARATPVFASEAEALAAATKAYAAYVKVSDEILAEGGNNPERIQEVATGVQLGADLSGFESARNGKVHSVGSTTFESVVLQQYDDKSDKGFVGVYLCEDVSNVDVVDAGGISVVTVSRPDRVKYQVTFDRSNDRSAELLVAKKTAWGDGKC
jgi:hypothetical protein